jgi:hypothetical protein
MELVDRTSSDGGGPTAPSDASRYDSRKDALADALGVQQRRSTPRNGAGGIDAAANSRVSRGGHGGTARSTHKGSRPNNNNNNSLISPRTANVSHNTTNMDISTDNNNTMISITRMGTFGSLFPNVAMICIYSDSTPTVPASKVFLASNLSGSGTRKLCLLCPSSQAAGNKTNKNPKELRMFSLELEKNESGEEDDGSDQFVVRLEATMPCIAAQPIRSSPIPKTYEPHRINRPKSWNGLAVDILLSHKDPTSERNRLSLYRGSKFIVDCSLFVGKETCTFDDIDLQNPVGNSLDILYHDETGKTTRCRGLVSLLLETSHLGETTLQTIDVGLERVGLVDIALKIRADVRRLEFQLSFRENDNLVPETIVIKALKTVILSLFCLDMLSFDVNAQADDSSPDMTDASQSKWGELSESNFESILHDCNEFLEMALQRVETARRREEDLPFDRLSKLQSLAVESIKASNGHVFSVLFDALHFLYEDFKLYASMRDAALDLIGSILSSACQMALRHPSIPNEVPSKFLQHYRRDVPQRKLDQPADSLIDQQRKTVPAHLDVQFSEHSAVPCILTWVERIIGGQSSTSCPVDFAAAEVNASCTRTMSLGRVLSLFLLTEPSDTIGQGHKSTHIQIANCLIEEGFTEQSELSDELPFGLALPLLEVLYRCRNEHTDETKHVNPRLWSLIGRNDLYLNSQASKYLPLSANTSGVLGHPSSQANEDVGASAGNKNDDGVDELEITSSMLFPDGNRIREVSRMLRSSRPIYLKVPRSIEVSDHDYERKKQEKLLLLSRRVLALPVGRGMLTIGHLRPIQAEPLPVPEINLSGRVPPTNASLALDTSECPADMKVWPDFHNGVAAGLRLPLQSMTGDELAEITRTWIVYNRSSNSQIDPQTNGNNSESNAQGVDHSHGGLLMALGMRGHLNALEMTDVFDYLTHGSITTTVGTLLGMAAK